MSSPIACLKPAQGLLPAPAGALRGQS